MSGLLPFDTAIGRCAVAWGDRGLTGVTLPEASGAASGEPPEDVLRAVEEIVALLRGEPRPLTDVVLDLDAVPAFDRAVYEVARTVGPGATTTYGEVAARLGGSPETARAVGQALARNPFPLVVPCHRVLAAGGRMHGFSAPGGTATKARLLSIEGALSAAPPLF